MKSVRCAARLALALLFSVSVASANEVQLSWTRCVDDGGVSNLNFACNSNAGSRYFHCAVRLSEDMANVISNEYTLRVAGAHESPIPPWWSLRHSPWWNYTACRPLGNVHALTISAVETPSCPDMFALMGSMNIADFRPDVPIAGNARILSVNAVPSTSPVQLNLADHPTGSGVWQVGRFQLNNQKTVGTPSCAGCSNVVWIALESVLVVTVGNVGNRTFSGGAHELITWQGDPVPVKSVSWGRVKSLYR